MPDFSGMSDSLGNTGFGGGYNDGGLEGAPDMGTLGGTMRNEFGDTSSDVGPTAPGQSSYTSPEQSQSNNYVNANPQGYDFGAAGMSVPGEWGLGELFGYNAQQGLPTGQGEFAGNEDSYGFSEFAQSPFGKTMRSILGMTPFGTVANMGISAALGQPKSQIAANAIPGLPGVAARAGLQAYNSPDAASSLGKSALGYGLGSLGSNAGYAVGGPVGGFIGGKLGGMAANAQGEGSTSAAQGTPGNNGSGFNLGNALGGLGSLYSGYQNQQISNQMAQGQASNNQALQGQMTNLANMYSPNSPYALQMRQQLARKDAASGRNSQYGPREAQLQALLAGQQAQASSSMANLVGAQRYDQMRAGNTANTQNLQNVLRLAQSSGLTDKVQGSLGDMFGFGIQTGGGAGSVPGGYVNEGVSYNNPSQYSAPSNSYATNENSDEFLKDW